MDLGDDLWVSRRESTDASWGEPENLAVLNSPFNDSLSVFSTSGNIMDFHSTRPVGELRRRRFVDISSETWRRRMDRSRKYGLCCQYW